jgi:hypothetical protein
MQLVACHLLKSDPITACIWQPIIIVVFLFQEHVWQHALSHKAKRGPASLHGHWEAQIEEGLAFLVASIAFLKLSTLKACCSSAWNVLQQLKQTIRT